MEWNESTFDAGEVQLRVLEGPSSGQPLVLLHGATGSADSWLGVAPQLARRRHVYLLDLRGHNLSTWAVGPDGYHFSRFTADVVAFLRQRVDGRAELIGHSLGAVIALLTAADPAGAQCVQAVVAEDPPLSIFRADGQAVVDGATQYFNAVAALKARSRSWDEVHAEVLKMSPELPPDAAELVTNEKFRLDPAFLHFVIEWGVISTGIDFPAALGAIACPVLLLQADPALGAALADEDAALVRRQVKQVQLVHFPGASHGIHSDQPAQFLAAVEEFIG